MIINFVAFQICWLAAVWGAANELGWLGPAGTLLFLAFELSRSTDRARDLRFLGVVAVIGLIVDTGYRQLGLIEYASPWPSAAIAPLWIVTMWICYGLTINSSLKWLNGNHWLGAAFGLIGGPAAYWIAAEIWGAASFTAAMPLALAVIGIAWAIATPALFLIYNAIERRSNPVGTPSAATIQGAQT